MDLRDLRSFLFGTLRGRLILSVAAVHAVMMTLFIFDSTLRQRAMLLDNQTKEAVALSQSLATSAAGWIMADDISGLQEIVDAEKRYPEMIFAMLADENGCVLAHTDKSKQGLFLLDLPHDVRQATLNKTPTLVDVATPAMLGNKHVGWARVGVGQKSAGEKLSRITKNGVMYTLAAITIGSIIAWWMGRRITRRLYAIQETINSVRAGNRFARSLLAGTDEAALIAHEFNSMLDVVAMRDVELRASEEKYRGLIQKVHAAIVVHGADTRILMSNRLAQRLLGLTEMQMMGKLAIDSDWHFFQEDGTILPLQEYPVNRVLSTGLAFQNVVVGVHRPNMEEDVWLLVSAEPVLDELGNLIQVVVTFVDITALRKTEEAQRRLNRELRAISDCNQILLRAEDEQSLLHDLCRIFHNEAGYRLTWVGYAENDEAKTIRPVAWAGVEDGYLAEAELTWADTERGRGPSGTAIRSGVCACIQDFKTDLNAAPWRVSALRCGFRSSIAIPLKDEKASTFGVLNIYSTQPNFFTLEEVRLLEELAGDLAFGIATLRARAERKRFEQKLALLNFALNNVHDEAYLINEQARFEYINDETCRVLGYNREELLGMNVTDIDPDFSVKQWAMHWRDLKARGVINFEGHHKTKDGGIYPVEISANYFEYKGTGYNLALARNITKRQQTAALLHQREQEFRTLVENSPDLVARYDHDCRRIYVNPAYLKVAEISHDKLIGVSPRQFSPLASAPAAALQDLIRRVIESGISKGMDFPLQRSDSTQLWFAVQVVPEFDSAGRVASVMSISRDITERKRAEEKIHELNANLELRVQARTRELTESEERFRTIYDMAPVSIWQEDWTEVIAVVRNLRNTGVTDFQAYFNGHPEIVLQSLNAVKILDVNHSTIGMFEARDKKDMLASLQTVFATPDTLPGFVGELIALAQGQTVYRTEMRLNTVKRHEIHVMLAMSFPSWGADSGNVLVSLIDITQRKKIEQMLKQNEERMRLFFERQLVGMAITSPQKGWLQVNDKLCQMLGYSREELACMTWSELTYPDDLAPDTAQFERLLKGEIEGYLLEKRFVRKDGNIVFTNLAVGCVRRSDRSVDYVLALLEDITERKRAEESIQKLNQELQQRAMMLEVTNKELESFSYSVSHDLRAPLRSMDGFSKILLEDYGGKLDAGGKHYLNIVRAASQRMGQMIDDILQLSRITRSELRRSTVNLSELANAVVEALVQTAPQRKVEFVIEPNCVALVDGNLMRIVLENLLGNAWKFTGKKPFAKIEFGVMKNERMPVYFVRDNGAGFDPKYTYKLFGAFQRLHAMNEFEGTGVGLASVQRTIHRHGGRVWIEGKVGEGATVYFTLPEPGKHQET